MAEVDVCVVLVNTGSEEEAARIVRVSDLIARVEVLHSYDVPEIIALPVVEGHAPYLDWVRENSR